MQRPTTADVKAIVGMTNPVLNWELNRSMIEAALEKSPTGGNAKPFSWYWNGKVLHIQHDLQKAAHYLNRNHHTSLIALGCLIASAEVAAQFVGLKVERQMLRPSDLSAELKFSAGHKELNGFENFDALLQRRTERGVFGSSAKPDVSSLNTTSPISVKVAGRKEISKEMTKFLTQADTYLWQQNHATRDFLKEIQFTNLPQTSSDRGIRVVDLGVGKMDQLLLKLFNLVPWLPTLFAHIPGLNSSFRAASLRSQKNAHYVLISAKDLRHESLIQAGHEAMMAWLQLQKQGYKVQPISMASITLVDAATGFLPQDTSQKYRRLFGATGPKVLQKQFGLTDVEHPVWMFRVGT